MASPKAKPAKPKRTKSSASQKVAAAPPAFVSQFAVGDRVVHPMFGAGAVDAVNGDKLDITFKKAGRKTIVEHFVKRA
jgi:DNA helicase-2/ATP-dependent DNA helicase PcrA